MNTSHLLTQSFKAMNRYKLRTAFMMLGSLVGAAALTFVLSVGQAAQAKMLRTVRQVLGESGVLIVGGGSRIMGSPRPGAARLTEDDIAALAREIPDVVVWDPQADVGGLLVRHENVAVPVRLLGSSERWQEAWGRSVSSGQSFDAAAVTSSARVALIGETVARNLFGSNDPLDAEIRIGAVPFRVIGVLERFGTDMHGMDRDNEIVVPISTLMRRLTNTDAIGAAKLVVREGSSAEAVAADAKRVLRGRHALDRDQPDDFMIISPVEVQQMVGTIRRILLLYVPLVASVALIVGGIVAAMVMLASVSQRVGEIGLRRAVGARAEDIRRQFVFETGTTILTGALVGIAIAYAGVQLVASRMQLGNAFSWAAVLLSLIAAALTGLLAGVVPARRAARLNPVDALR